MKLAMTVTAAGFALVAIAIPSNAQNQRLGAGTIHTTTQNFTPIIKEVACGGYTGRRGCGPGWTWSYRWHRCVRC
jgi:hypothetical protein